MVSSLKNISRKKERKEKKEQVSVTVVAKPNEVSIINKSKLRKNLSVNKSGDINKNKLKKNLNINKDKDVKLEANINDLVEYKYNSDSDFILKYSYDKFKFKFNSGNNMNKPWHITNMSGGGASDFVGRFKSDSSAFLAKNNSMCDKDLINFKDSYIKFSSNYLKYDVSDNFSNDVCVIVGGGKTTEYFDFSVLESLRKIYGNVHLWSCNGGSIFCESDCVWCSSGILMQQFQYRSFIDNKPQIATILHSSHESDEAIFDDKMFFDIKYSYDLPKNYDVFKNDVDNFSLARSGNDLGLFAIKSALSLGFSKIFLIGFDGRVDCGSPKVKDILDNNWAGDPSLTNVAYNKIVGSNNSALKNHIKIRNDENTMLFHMVKKYCCESDIELKWLTPSIYVEEDKDYYFMSYKDLSRRYIDYVNSVKFSIGKNFISNDKTYVGSKIKNVNNLVNKYKSDFKYTISKKKNLIDNSCGIIDDKKAVNVLSVSHNEFDIGCFHDLVSNKFDNNSSIDNNNMLYNFPYLKKHIINNDKMINNIVVLCDNLDVLSSYNFNKINSLKNSSNTIVFGVDSANCVYNCDVGIFSDYEAFCKYGKKIINRKKDTAVIVLNNSLSINNNNNIKVFNLVNNYNSVFSYYDFKFDCDKFNFIRSYSNNFLAIKLALCGNPSKINVIGIDCCDINDDRISFVYFDYALRYCKDKKIDFKINSPSRLVDYNDKKFFNSVYSDKL